MSVAADALLVARKDLRIEAHSRVVATQIVPFGALVIVLFAFAIDTSRELLPRVAPGLFWIAILLASLLAVSRSVSVEAEHGARDSLRLSALDPGAIFLGKTGAVVCELLLLEILLLIGVFALYDVELKGIVVLIPAAIAATVGLAATGIVYGILAAGLRVRETLVPLLALPVCAPVLLGGTRAFAGAFDGDNGAAWPWVQLLVVFAAVSLVAGVLAFGALLEDS